MHLFVKISKTVLRFRIWCLLNVKLNVMLVPKAFLICRKTHWHGFFRKRQHINKIQSKCADKILEMSSKGFK